MTSKPSACDVSKIAVVGAGTMGSSIAVAVSELGVPVKIIDANTAALENGLKKIDQLFAGLERKADSGENRKADIRSRHALISSVDDYRELSDVDLVIEAVNEDIEVKREVLSALDKICSPKTIFASNTSSFSITQLASFTKRSEQVIGLHFFNPAHLMPLVEIVPGLNTSSKTVDFAFDFVKQIGKLPVRVEECASFLVNRLLGRYINEAIWILQAGLADVKTIDEAACELLMPVGPLQLRDMNGLDIGLSVARFNYQEYGERFKPPDLMEEMVEQGLLGKKAGRGFYEYDPEVRKPIRVNGEIEKLVHTIKVDAKISGKLPTFEPLQMFLPMINEAFLVMQEKIVNVQDIDPALKAGLGMRKGLLEFACGIGLDKCLNKIESLYKIYGERYRPAPLLKRYVWAGRRSI